MTTDSPIDESKPAPKIFGFSSCANESIFDRPPVANVRAAPFRRARRDFSGDARPVLVASSTSSFGSAFSGAPLKSIIKCRDRLI